MTSNQLHVTSNKKNLTLTVEQMVMFNQCKIIEGMDQEGNTYYLYFYKNNFINGVKTNKININSFTHRAFQRGITMEANHPSVQALLRLHNSFHLQSFNQLFKHLQHKFSEKEIAVMFTFFDSFISKETIIKLFKKTYYQYRRNGQMLSAYQLLRILQQYDPNDAFVKDMIHNLQFQRYEKLYEDPEKLVNSDSIFFELISFDHLEDRQQTSTLLHLYKTENRWNDELIVRTHLLRHYYSHDNFNRIKEMIDQLDPIGQAYILQTLSQFVQTHPELQNQLITHHLQEKQYDETIKVVFSTGFQPSDEQSEAIMNSFTHTAPSTLLAFFSIANKRILEIVPTDVKKQEQLIRAFVYAALPHKSIDEIIDWFAPFHELNLHFPIEQKLKTMQQLENDPDQQYELGELYIYFNQLEKAIDCFKWEMELHPEDKKIVQALVALLKKAGETEEAAVYQQLLIQMQKSS
ncbi:hypothetical protein NC661_15205 [Aquibacillus koreensis]|uniref:Tetratricopeptide repeat protein n=1 Tax=Aquibacillus koreensis TaxID=279446 RepID=A0A9X4AJE7_9BACI|nr:hypothetical protein [Aquibacillus koreensis]MCT2534412.1 hypothetical protein [Aquibacillus koreensis]MDC3421719.1 hypothetical protein [Aquibacillus koreensis]